MCLYTGMCIPDSHSYYLCVYDCAFVYSGVATIMCVHGRALEVQEEMWACLGGLEFLVSNVHCTW